MFYKNDSFAEDIKMGVLPPNPQDSYRGDLFKSHGKIGSYF